jgi:ATP-dependent Clp protease ATP-binding subunit ClpC
VLIMTSNIGAQLIRNQGTMGFAKRSEDINYDQMKKVLREEMEKAFRPEFINRLDDTIVFRQLNRDDLKGIVRIQTRHLEERLKEKGFVMDLTDEAYERLIGAGFNPDFGARPLRRAIERLLEDPLSERILGHAFKAPARIVVHPVDEDSFAFESEPLTEWPKTRAELERERKAREKAEKGKETAAAAPPADPETGAAPAGSGEAKS